MLGNHYGRCVLRAKNTVEEQGNGLLRNSISATRATIFFDHRTKLESVAKLFLWSSVSVLLSDEKLAHTCEKLAVEVLFCKLSNFMGHDCRLPCYFLMDGRNKRC